ncbi:hypothetical protein HZA97_00900 [Candidatus Woesearchaeota archaeon]|nr:hypothetical protein [Candidatus Woesearchaeota archaeon]
MSSLESYLLDELKRQFNLVISKKRAMEKYCDPYFELQDFEELLGKTLKEQEQTISTSNIQKLLDLLNHSNEIIATVQSLYNEQFQSVPPWEIDLNYRSLAEKLYDFMEREREVQKSCSRKVQEFTTKNSSISTPIQISSSNDNKKTASSGNGIFRKWDDEYIDELIEEDNVLKVYDGTHETIEEIAHRRALGMEMEERIARKSRRAVQGNYVPGKEISSPKQESEMPIPKSESEINLDKVLDKVCKIFSIVSKQEKQDQMGSKKDQTSEKDLNDTLKEVRELVSGMKEYLHGKTKEIDELLSGVRDHNRLYEQIIYKMSKEQTELKQEVEELRKKNPSIDLETKIELFPLDEKSADKGTKKTPTQWSSYWGGVKDDRIRVSMSDLWFSFGMLIDKYLNGSEEEKINARNLVLSLQDDFDFPKRSNWLITNTSLNYLSPGLNAKIIHNVHCKELEIIREVEVPIYTFSPITQVVSTIEGMKFLRTLFNTTDDAEIISRKLEFISGKSGEKILISTPPIQNSKENRQLRQSSSYRCVGLYYASPDVSLENSVENNMFVISTEEGVSEQKGCSRGIDFASSFINYAHTNMDEE